MGKVRYRVRNWREYNKALKDRYRLELWLSDDVIERWYAEPTGKRGAQPIYSDEAIVFSLTIRELFRLPLRGCEGFLESILKFPGLRLQVPDYTTLSRRSGELEVALHINPKERSIYVVFDSSGLKIYGEGEWKVRVHGISKRRTWRKIHIGVDESTSEILVASLTTADVGDSEMLPEMLKGIRDLPIDKVGGDGAFDTKGSYEAAREIGAEAIFPPRRGALIWGSSGLPPPDRDRHIIRIREIGRKRWKLESGYSRRSLAETGIYRLKRIFGDRLRSRVFKNQAQEAFLRVRALNIMTSLGMPESYAFN